MCFALKDRNVHCYVVNTKEIIVTPIQIEWDFRCTLCIYLQPGRLFGLECKYEHRTVLVDLGNRSVEVHSSLRVVRDFPGLCRYQNCIYAFGGRRVKTCEKFDLTVKTWFPLPDCKHERESFTPVPFRALIYLPNGFNETIETFNPVSQQFTLLKFSTGIQFSTTSVILHRRLYIFGTDYCFIWDLERMKGTIRMYKEKINTAFSAFPPVTNGTVVALVWSYGYLKVAIMNMKELEVQLIDLQV